LPSLNNSPKKLNSIAEQIEKLNNQVDEIDASNKEESEKQLKAIAKSAYTIADQINLLK
jgi:GR25 family glycosyltransferase involved in LPS biosynthesis